MGKTIRERVTSGLGLLWGSKTTIIGKKRIMDILPHRGKMLLLDQAWITEETVSGVFLVTEAVCEGHQFDGQLIFKGSDLLDMAAQVLGVWADVCHGNEFSPNKIAVVREYKEARFSNPVFPSHHLVMRVAVKDLRIEIRESNGRRLIKVIGENFLAEVDGEKKAEISGVVLVVKET